jgi:hypothetical protein
MMTEGGGFCLMGKNNIFNVLVQCFQATISEKDRKDQKVSPLQLVVCLVFSLIKDSKDRTLEGIRRILIFRTGITIARGSFWERLNAKKLEKMLISLLYELMARLACNSINVPDFSAKLGVLAVMMIDSSSVSLWDVLAKKFPGTLTTAGIKGHTCFNLFTGLLEWIELTPSSTHDRKCFPIDVSILKNKLIIFDLGYWDFKLLFLIDEIKGYFLSRVKKNSKIIITGIVSGLGRKYIGYFFSELNLKKKNGDIVELLGEIMIDNQSKIFRLIGFWNKNDKIYHWYITNLLVSADVIYPLYRLRWRIELIFKSAKRCFNFSDIPSGKETIVNVLILSSLIAQLSSYTILSFASHKIEQDRLLALSVQRVAKVMVILSGNFISLLLKPTKENMKILIDKIKLFINELFDPNIKNRATGVSRLNGILSTI